MLRLSFQTPQVHPQPFTYFNERQLYSACFCLPKYQLLYYPHYIHIYTHLCMEDVALFSQRQIDMLTYICIHAVHYRRDM